MAASSGCLVPSHVGPGPSAGADREAEGKVELPGLAAAENRESYMKPSKAAPAEQADNATGASSDGSCVHESVPPSHHGSGAQTQAVTAGKAKVVKCVDLSQRHANWMCRRERLEREVADGDDLWKYRFDPAGEGASVPTHEESPVTSSRCVGPSGCQVYKKAPFKSSLGSLQETKATDQPQVMVYLEGQGDYVHKGQWERFERAVLDVLNPPVGSFSMWENEDEPRSAMRYLMWKPTTGFDEIAEAVSVASVMQFALQGQVLCRPPEFGYVQMVFCEGQFETPLDLASQDRLWYAENMTFRAEKKTSYYYRAVAPPLATGDDPVVLFSVRQNLLPNSITYDGVNEMCMPYVNALLEHFGNPHRLPPRETSPAGNLNLLLLMVKHDYLREEASIIRQACLFLAQWIDKDVAKNDSWWFRAYIKRDANFLWNWRPSDRFAKPANNDYAADTTDPFVPCIPDYVNHFKMEWAQRWGSDPEKYDTLPIVGTLHINARDYVRCPPDREVSRLTDMEDTIRLEVRGNLSMSGAARRPSFPGTPQLTPRSAAAAAGNLDVQLQLLMSTSPWTSASE